MKNAILASLLCTIASATYACETEIPNMSVIVQSTSSTPDNNHIIRWQQQSLNLLNKQVAETNVCALTVYLTHDTKKPQQKDFSLKSLARKAANKSTQSILNSNLTAAIYKELRIRKRIRNTWQHLEPQQAALPTPLLDQSKKQQAKL